MDQKTNQKQMSQSLVISTAALLLFALAAYWLCVLRVTGRWQGLWPLTAGWVDLIWLFAGSITAAVMLVLFVKIMTPAQYYSEEIVIMSKSYKMPQLSVLFFFNALSEELLFRGALQAWLGFVPAALLFTAVHVAYYKKPFLLVYVFFMGLLLGFLYLLSGSLWVCTLAHMFVNCLSAWFIQTGRIKYER